MESLFAERDLFQGDPLNPDLTTVTPPEVVASLTASERETRVKNLIDQAHHIVDWAWQTVLGHLMKDRVDYAVHCNTTIGIEQTRIFVRVGNPA